MSALKYTRLRFKLLFITRLQVLFSGEVWVFLTKEPDPNLPLERIAGVNSQWPFRYLKCPACWGRWLQFKKSNHPDEYEQHKKIEAR